MKNSSIFLKTLALSCILFSAAIHTNAQQSPSITIGVERLLNYIENHIVDIAEVMPEDKFYFTPESLNIKG
ncbi:MAG TPA: hypothetical protein VK787_10870, partial [Puia sp.]|nr:hypothetical protein [Puia sp.]